MSKEATIDNQITCIDEKIYKSSLLSNKVKKEIQEQVFDYLTKSDLENLPKDAKFVIESLRNDLLEGCGRSFELKNTEIQQFAIRLLGEEHKQVDFVLKIGDTVRSITTVTNEETGELVDITNSDETKGDGEKLLEESMIQNTFFKNPDYTKTKSIKIENDEIDENVFNGVTGDWNEDFEGNRNDLKDISNNDKRKEIIENNAENISKRFQFLQGTVEKGNSAKTSFDNFVARYFEHFLSGSPVLIEKEVLEYKRIEEGVLIAKGNYKFEVLGENNEPKVINANFTFKFEKVDGGWIVAGLHSYLDIPENSNFNYNYEK